MEKNSAVDNFANIWMVDYVIIIFYLVRYNKYEYLQHDVFPLCSMMSFISFLCYCVAKNQLKFILSS